MKDRRPTSQKYRIVGRIVKEIVAEGHRGWGGGSQGQPEHFRGIMFRQGQLHAGRAPPRPARPGSPLTRLIFPAVPATQQPSGLDQRVQRGGSADPGGAPGPAAHCSPAATLRCARSRTPGSGPARSCAGELHARRGQHAEQVLQVGPSRVPAGRLPESQTGDRHQCGYPRWAQAVAHEPVFSTAAAFRPRYDRLTERAETQSPRLQS